MRILSWHLHAAWSTAFVSGPHDYLIPVLPDRGAYGRGRPRTYAWPANAIELTPEALRQTEVDVAVLQRPEEEGLVRRWLGREVPLIYVEHNTPKGNVPLTRHPLADRDDVQLVHVTHFNDAFWDCGTTPTTVIEHGLPVPRPRWTGELGRLAVVTNEPVRRGRITGTDLLGRFSDVAPLDVYGMGVAPLASARIAVHDDPPQARMHAEVARRRAYLHLTRWTSLGLSLIEAMMMGCPVIVLATTEAATAVPPGGGVVSTNVAKLMDAARHYLSDRDAAQEHGATARAYACYRFGLARFLADWERLLAAVTESPLTPVRANGLPSAVPTGVSP
jgi:hypothetical protein